MWSLSLIHDIKVTATRSLVIQPPSSVTLKWLQQLFPRFCPAGVQNLAERWRAGDAAAAEGTGSAHRLGLGLAGRQPLHRWPGHRSHRPLRPRLGLPAQCPLQQHAAAHQSGPGPHHRVSESTEVLEVAVEHIVQCSSPRYQNIWSLTLSCVNHVWGFCRPIRSYSLICWMSNGLFLSSVYSSLSYLCEPLWSFSGGKFLALQHDQASWERTHTFKKKTAETRI